MPDFKNIKSDFPNTVWDGTSQNRSIAEKMHNPDGFDRAKAVAEIIALQQAVLELLG